MSKRIKILQGYVKNNKFGPYSLPVKYQNQIMKFYCDQNNKIYSLPQAEPVFSKNFIQLRSLIFDLGPNTGLVMLSMFMLPDDSADRNKIYKMILKKETNIHFVFENIIVSSEESFINIEHNFKYLNFTKDS